MECVRCRRGGLAESDVYMSADGWLCEACWKAWDQAEAAKQPKPLLHRSKKSLAVAELPDGSVADFARGKQRRAASWVATGLALTLLGVLATRVLHRWLVEGGEIPALVGAGPLLVLVGVLLGVWGLVDWIRAR